MVERELVLVLEVAAGRDGAEDVVLGHVRRDVEAVRVEVGVAGMHAGRESDGDERVLDEDVQRSPGQATSSGPGELAVVDVA